MIWVVFKSTRGNTPGVRSRNFFILINQFFALIFHLVLLLMAGLVRSFTPLLFGPIPGLNSFYNLSILVWTGLHLKLWTFSCRMEFLLCK